MSISFANASFKDFENIPGMDVTERANHFYDFLGYMADHGHMNYRFLNLSGCGPEMQVITHVNPSPQTYVSFVSDD